MIARLLRQLWKRAATVETQPCYWFSSQFDIPGTDWCFNCAKKRADELRAKHPDVVIDGGWDVEKDSPPYCEGCGRRLEYSPTDYCTEQELAHFAGFRFRKMSPDMAYDLVRIFENAAFIKDQDALRMVAERTKRALRSSSWK